MILFAWCMQGAQVLGPVPAPFLAPAKPKVAAPAMAPAPAAAALPDTPLSFLIKGITNLAEQASTAANSGSGRRLQQQPARPGQPGPQQPAPGQPQVSCCSDTDHVSFLAVLSVHGLGKKHRFWPVGL
jgi:hypothetical protein